MKKITKLLSTLLLALALVFALSGGKQLLADIDPPIGSPTQTKVVATIDPPIGSPSTTSTNGIDPPIG